MALADAIPVRSLVRFRGRRPRASGPPLLLQGLGVVIAGIVALPLLYLVLRTGGAGWSAWQGLFHVHTLGVLWRTVTLALAVPLASAILAVPLAWLTTRTDLPLRRFWSVVTLLPLIIPSYVGAFLIIAALGPRGHLQQALEVPLGIDRLPDIYGFPGALLTLSFLSYPYMLLPVRAAFQRMDPALEDASRGLGHGAWSTFRSVTLPLLRPSIAAGALLIALYTLSDFGAVSLMRYETFTWAIYLQYDSSFDRTVAAGLALLLVLLALGVLLIESRTRGRALYYQSAAMSQRPPTLMRLRRWRWPTFLFPAGVAFFSLVVPLTVLAYWVVRGVMRGEPLFVLWSAMGNSLYVSGLAAAATLAAGLPVALLLVRYRGALSAFIERAAYAGFALPGVVVALALVFFGATFATLLYQSLALLVFAYLTLFLAAALGPLQASLRAVNPRYEEAARSLGRRSLRSFFDITLPLMRPGILAGAALVFLLTMKELPATLLLAPIGLDTLATSIWSAALGAFLAQAAMPALLLVLVSAVPLTILHLRGWGQR